MLIDQLREAIGSSRVVTSAQTLAPLLIDNRRRFHGQALCVCFPRSTEQVARLMQVCARNGAWVVAQGGNTGNAAGATPVVSNEAAQHTVLVSLRDMNAIESVDTVNDTVCVQAGAVMQTLQEHCAAHGRLFGVSLAAQGSCQIGGALSTNAGGVHVLRYGSMREQCLGLEVVLPDGRVLDLMRGLRKDNTGYDLKQLFIGAEGTLGLITRAVLKLHPLPRASQVAVLALPALGCVEPVFEQIHSQLGSQLSAFELMHVDTIRKVRDKLPDVPIGFALSCPWYVLVEAEQTQGGCPLDSILEQLLEAGCIEDAVLAQSQAQSQALWRVRESIASAHKLDGGNVKHDISVPRSGLVAFIEQTNAALQAQFDWIAPSVFGHYGDGNLHYNMGVAPGFDRQLCFTHEEAIHRTVYAGVAAMHGSIAAEHGIGRLKTDALKQVKSPVEYELMRTLKQTLDPYNRMNPGALFPLTPSVNSNRTL